MNKETFLTALKGLMAIESVAMVDADEQHPYGTGPAKALACVLDLCRELGIPAVNLDGKTAWAEIGSGDEIVGILGHLDVVPVGEGWTHDPKGEVCGDRLYGRGAADDKGPTLAALFAMKDLLDSGVPLKRRVRLIFGQCEETGGWEDMEYYAAHEPLPVYGFTPDADFPAIYGEKGILNYELSLPLETSGLLSAEGGDAENMVPGWARAAVPTPDGPKAYAAQGHPAHASTPEKGVNAISKLMDALAADGVESPLVEFYQKHIGFDLTGERMGCGFSDEQSGGLTLNAGLLRTVGDRVVLTLDIRSPVTVESGRVRAAIEAACAPYGISVACTEDMKSIYMDKNGRVITAMLEVYREVTGDLSEPTVIGGGTYARAMPGIVAFGPMQPGRECTEHQKDEYILLEDLFQAEEIYRRTIEKLANLEEIE
ncbi:MAG: Sapep family Mn(2+)-dependent dipeptidase [Oscillospiraceae bacterium]|nr:Sapep family Mn(2+)-dependent dipeptidase [Oscillospiraceae bacterium]